MFHSGPHGRATLKSPPRPDTIQPLCAAKGEKLSPLFTAQPPPRPLPRPPFLPITLPSLVLAGGTIGEGLAQSRGGVAGQQNGL